MINKSTASEIIVNEPSEKDTEAALALMLKMANKRLKASLEEIQVIKSMQAKMVANKNSSS